MLCSTCSGVGVFQDGIKFLQGVEEWSYQCGEGARKMLK